MPQEFFACGDTIPVKHVCIVGGGFTGLTAALDLAEAGYRVTLLEADEQVGGLAGAFRVGDTMLEKFYHHWFTSDRCITDMVKRLHTEDQVVLRESRTGMYYAKNFFKLSTPTDLLHFTPLSLLNRLRLGVSVVMARRYKDWRGLEDRTAEEWLLSLCGRTIYDIVWKPLLIGKFGELYAEVSAVWMWNKLKLRGGSRGASGAEELAYYRGGFAALAEQMAARAEKHGATLLRNTVVTGFESSEGKLTVAHTPAGPVAADEFILTTPLPIAADLLQGHVPPGYEAQLRRIRHLSNLCLVLILDRSLSSTYWLNVNDPSFPFVAIVEHTNFEPATEYGGKHIVYLSKYLPPEAELFRMEDDDVFAFSVRAIQRMFPAFRTEWVEAYHVWRANYAQPIIEQHYGAMIPAMQTPIENLTLSTMSQVYPEDRGTNYAVRGGHQAAAILKEKLSR